MRHANRILLALVGALIGASSGMAAEPAPQKPEHPLASATEGTAAIAAQRAWWTAFVVADTQHLQASSAPVFLLTPSSGKTYDRAAMLAEAATHAKGKIVWIEWSDEAVQFPEPTVAVVSSRVTETAEGPTSAYRYLTVLRRFGTDWRVAAAQSTRELTLTPPVPVAVSGALNDYAGSYRTPKGFVLRIEALDSRLMLIEPSGQEIPLEPVGPGLFELDRLSLSNGLVRMMFTRDASGKVTSFSRLLVGAVNTFTRLP